MSAVTVSFFGGPFDGQFMAVPADGTVPRNHELVVMEPLASLREWSDTADGHLEVGIRRCYYDLALSPHDVGPTFRYLYRQASTLY